MIHPPENIGERKRIEEAGGMVSMQRVDGACPYASTRAFSVFDLHQPLDLHMNININHPYTQKK